MWVIRHNFTKNRQKKFKIFFVFFTAMFLVSINVFLTTKFSEKRFMTGNKSNLKIKSKIVEKDTLLNDTKLAYIPNDVKTLYTKLEHVNSTSSNQPRDSEKDNLTDLIITVKTTKLNHVSRLIPIIKTWFKLIPSKVYFISDEYDQLISNLTSEII